MHPSHDAREMIGNCRGNKSRDIIGSEVARRLFRDTRRGNSRSGRLDAWWISGRRSSVTLGMSGGTSKGGIL